MFYCNTCAIRQDWPFTMFKSSGRCESCGKVATCNDRRSIDLPMSPKVNVPRADIYDRDAPHVELDGEAVARVKWVESGLGVEFADGEFRLVPEDDRFVCGMVYVSGRELNLIFGEWVTARKLRYG